ncbi:MAG: NADH-quinone oxidoreductase subunit NuoK [Candidatus Bipolaricaulia bacterium]
MVPVTGYIAVSGILFAIGIWGLLTSRNGIKILICIELLLNAANINLAAFSSLWRSQVGYVFVLFSIALAAAEAAVGLSILIVLFRKVRSIDLGRLRRLRW